MLEFAPTKIIGCYKIAWLYCLTLDYNGHKDWRLPTDIEYTSCKDIDSNSYYSHDAFFEFDPDFQDVVSPVRDKQ